MKLFIQARKDGWNRLYPASATPAEFFQFAGDIQRIDAANDARYYGKSVHSIAFADGGCIFTKVLIVYDGQRGGLGNVGFSIFVPNTKKMPGSDVRLLLDELAKTYCVNYCPDFKYLPNIQADWTLLSALVSQSESKLKNNPAPDNMQPGTADPAVIYYADDTELQRYFDAPYQAEYSTYKQVFFVEKNLEGTPENPINALKHNPQENLTGKIELQNPYKLLFSPITSDGAKIEVKVNGSSRYSGNKIRRKDELQITYSKPYHYPAIKTGRWDELGNEFLSVDDNAETVKIREATPKEVTPQPITKNIIFVIKDRNGIPINDAEIQVGGSQPYQKVNGNQYEHPFKGEELGKYWTISGKKDNSFGEIKILPENQTGSITLRLEEKVEKNTIALNVIDKDSMMEISDFEVSTKLTNGFEKRKQLVFVGEQIKNNYTITIRAEGYEDSVTHDFAPVGNVLDIRLEKQKKSKKYRVEIGKGKKKKGVKGSIEHSFYSNGKDVKDYIEPPRGQKLSHFEIKGDAIIAIYEKNEDASFLSKKNIGIGVGVFLAAVAITLLIVSKSGNQPRDLFEDPKKKIERYVTGIELNADTLNHFIRLHCLQTTTPSTPAPAMNNRAVNNWRNLWGLLHRSRGSEGTVVEATQNAPFCRKLKDALDIRNAINAGNIKKLRDKRFSIQQDKFKRAIHSIESEFIEPISDSLRNRASGMDLNAIAELIKNEQNKNRRIRDEQQRAERARAERAEAERAERLKKEFWRLVHSGSNTKADYDALFERYPTHYSNPYRIFMVEHLQRSTSFNRFRSIPEMQRKDARTLEELRRLINEQQ